MASTDIKQILTDHYRNATDQYPDDWKRVSKKVYKAINGSKIEVREFSSAILKIQVVTIEIDGKVGIVETEAALIAFAVSLGDSAADAATKVAALGLTFGGAPVTKQPQITQEDLDTVRAELNAIASPAKAAPKAPATPKTPNKKALMKKGTKWRVTQDCVIHGWVDNPAYYVEMRRLDAAHISGQPRVDALQKVGKHMKIEVAKLKAGTVLTVTGKLVADLNNSVWFNGGQKTEGNGHGVPFSFKLGDNELLNAKVHRPVFAGHQPYLQPGEAIITGDDVIAVLGYKFVEQFLEQEGEAAEQYIYLLRNKTTGLFYKMIRHDMKQYIHAPEWDAWTDAREKAFPRQVSSQAESARWTQWHKDNKFEGKTGHYALKAVKDDAEYFEWEAKVTKAKQYADMGKMKTSILNFIGYHNGLEEPTHESGSWVENIRSGDGDEVGYPFLSGFEAVKMEKFSKREIEIIDLQSWYERTIRLRRITATYGSSVRSLYNKLDKASEIDAWPYVVVFRSGKKDRWDETIDLTPEQTASIDDTIVQLGGSPKKVKRAKAFGSLAVAVDSLSFGFGLKMGADDTTSAIIELKTMQEMVQE
jgi:hypothetical protein